MIKRSYEDGVKAGYEQAMKDYGLFQPDPFIPFIVKKEILITIEGYPNYQISNLGRVYSLYTKRFLKPFLSRPGYKIITLCVNNKYPKYSIHRLVATHFLKEQRQPGMIVHHMDGNKLNNRADNLQWVSYSYNIKHAYLNGLNISQKGEKHFASKITNKQVLEIRDMLDRGLTYTEIAPKYGVSTTCIGSIKRGTRRVND